MPHTVTGLRPYQRRAYDAFKKQSGLIVLPTGAGKTLIASAVAVNYFRRGEKVLFLVPKCLLVTQQAAALRYEGRDQYTIAEYQGGSSAPVGFDGIVATPAAFINLNRSRDEFQYEQFGLIIFDEVHYVIKRHQYRTIARDLRALTTQPHLLGLSASLTYAVGSERIERAIEELCSDLQLSGDCIFTASEEELLGDGFHGTTPSQVDLRSDVSLDDDGRQLLELPGQPHETLAGFLRHVKERCPPIHRLSICLMDVVGDLEALIKQNIDSTFRSPIGQIGKQGRVAAWGEYAHKKQSTVQGGYRPYHVLEHLYESARIIANSKQCALELAMHYLEMNSLLKRDEMEGSSSLQPTDKPESWEITLLQPLQELWDSTRNDFHRLAHLKDVLLQQWDTYQDDLRCIVFVQQRVTTHILCHFISNDADLRFLSCGVLYATSSNATPSLSICPSVSRDRLAAFASGEIQILISTAVAEEGMDVPAANCVIRFDAVQTPVSLVQSRGRARQADSSFVIMREMNSRSVESLEQAEQEQLQVISTIRERGVGSNADVDRQRAMAHQSRLRNAKAFLDKYFVGCTDQASSPLGALNIYAQKIQGHFSQVVNQRGTQWVATVELDQYGSLTMTEIGEGQSKKDALHVAALKLLDRLHQE